MDYDIRNGRTYMYHQGPVLYPFGYGLSYSDFTYEKIESVKQDKKNIRVTVSVKNTSGRDGEEVVQLYASYPTPKWNVLPSSCAPSGVSPSRPAKPGK